MADEQRIAKKLEEVNTAMKALQDKIGAFETSVKDMSKKQGACVKDMGDIKKQLRALSDDVKSAKSVDAAAGKVYAAAIIEKSAMLRKAELLFPQKNSMLLRLALGDVNVTLPKMGDRFKYKTEYENFKMKMTIVTIALSFLNLFVLHYRLMDAVFNVLLVWHYCTITLREHILLANGSRIRGWWLTHHYLSITLSAVFLIWPDGLSYRAFRNQFLVFSIYLGCVQLLQFRYQIGRLYTLRALGKTDSMEIISDTAGGSNSSSLNLLLPFLAFGYLFQFYNSYTLFKIATDPALSSPWEVAALGALFLVLAIGNSYTTFITVRNKASRDHKKKSS
eukprot:Opistho-2@95576